MFAALKGKTFLALFSPTDRLHFLPPGPERNSTQGQEEASPSMLQNNTHIFFTAFLTVFTCFHSLTTVNVYCEGEALRNTMISHNELRQKSQIFTQTEVLAVLLSSQTFSAHLLSVVLKRKFSVHTGARASTTEGKTTSPGIWREGKPKRLISLKLRLCSSISLLFLFSSTSMIHSRKSSQAGSVEPVTLKPSCPSPPPTANNGLPSDAEDRVLGNLSA